MAKVEYNLTGNVTELLRAIDNGILSGSASASFEDGSDFYYDGVRCSVRVYERYSWFGGNRVSLNITVLSNGSSIRLSAITSGGSQAMFFKVNTIGEESFLEKLDKIVSNFR